MTGKKSAITVQLGARRQYAVPAALAQEGHLDALYTDICVGKGLGRVTPILDCIPPLAKRFNLNSRRPPEKVLSHTHVFQRWFLEMQYALRKAEDQVDRIRCLRLAHNNAARAMIHHGYGQASYVVSMFGEATGYLVEAKRRGLITITDMNIAPSTEALVRDEQASYADWEEPKIFYGQARAAEAGVEPIMDSVLRATDFFICPSEFVRNDLMNNFGVSAERALLVPYAVNSKWLKLTPHPVRGRILFAGGAELRKGIHVLAQAARILAQSDATCEVRVAGFVAQHLRTRPECKHLNFLGRLTPRQMEEEFATADVFALPSLAEGSAGVTYEALGAGVPVVTTFEAGSVVRNGVDGSIVAAKNPHALAEAIVDILRDRDKRAFMAKSARARARSFSWDAYGPRLTAAIFNSSGYSG